MPDDLVRAYLTHLRDARGLRASSLGSYFTDLRWADTILRAAGAELAAPTPGSLAALRAALVAANPATARRRICALRGLWTFADDAPTRAALAVVSAVRLPPQRGPRRPPVDVARVVAAASSRPLRSDLVHEGVRDAALLGVLYDLGPRVSDLLALTVADVDLAAGTVAGRAVDPATAAALRSYLATSRGALNAPVACAALFVSWRGSLTRQGVWKIVAACAKAAGVRASPQAFATDLRRRQADADRAAAADETPAWRRARLVAR